MKQRHTTHCTRTKINILFTLIKEWMDVNGQTFRYQADMRKIPTITRFLRCTLLKQYIQIIIFCGIFSVMFLKCIEINHSTIIVEPPCQDLIRFKHSMILKLPRRAGRHNIQQLKIKTKSSTIIRAILVTRQKRHQ